MFKCNAALWTVQLLLSPYPMSLNRYEHSLHHYLETHPDEERHWRGKVTEVAKCAAAPGDAARGLERELWEYFTERSRQVPELRQLHAGGLRRVSLLNLAEYLLRVWSPPPPPKRP
ncbi:MAG: hypothetical protein ACHQ5A_06255 [Opitutales bacterium]